MTFEDKKAVTDELKETAEVKAAEVKATAEIVAAEKIAAETKAGAEKLGAEKLAGAKVVAAGDGVVTYEQGGERRELAGLDNVILAMGSKPDTRLLEEAQAKGIEAYAVGDCAKPGNVFDATHSAFEVAIHL